MKIGGFKMDAKTILIIALVLYMAFWYKNPDKGRDYIDQGVDKIQNIWNKQNLVCTQQYDPVCADGITYNNQCLAQKAGKMNITLGVCQ